MNHKNCCNELDIPLSEGNRREHAEDLNARRSFLRAGAFSLVAPLSIGSALAATSGAPANPAKSAKMVTAAEVLKLLMEGNARYVGNKPNERDFSSTRHKRVTDHKPIAVVLGCADARVSPELIFDQPVGNLFVTSVAGNYLNAASLSSIEYAVAVLATPLVIVLGHSQCGAVAAAIQSINSKSVMPGTIQDVINGIQPAVVRATAGGTANLTERSTIENVKFQEQTMETRPSLVKNMFDQKKIDIVGAVYDIASGKVTLV